MKKIALFAGSFDPPTMGHLDIIEKAKVVCDQLIISIQINPAKKPLFSADERVKMLKLVAPDAEVISSSLLTADVAKENGVCFLIRGLRSYMEFDREWQMALINKELCQKETCFFVTKEDYSKISSSIVREIAQLKGPLAGLVPKAIIPFLEKKFA